jgi:hypothetical protein
LGTSHAAVCVMGDAPQERRRHWTRELHRRLKEYEDQWQSQPEAIREALHDERSRTVHNRVRDHDVERAAGPAGARPKDAPTSGNPGRDMPDRTDFHDRRRR